MKRLVILFVILFGSLLTFGQAKSARYITVSNADSQFLPSGAAGGTIVTDESTWTSYLLIANAPPTGTLNTTPKLIYESSGGGVGTLQQVTELGATTDRDVTFTGDDVSFENTARFDEGILTQNLEVTGTSLWFGGLDIATIISKGSRVPVTKEYVSQAISDSIAGLGGTGSSVDLGYWHFSDDMFYGENTLALQTDTVGINLLEIGEGFPKVEFPSLTHENINNGTAFNGVTKGWVKDSLMTSFDVMADNGTTYTVFNGDVVDFTGGQNITTTRSGNLINFDHEIFSNTSTSLAAGNIFSSVIPSNNGHTWQFGATTLDMNYIDDVDFGLGGTDLSVNDIMRWDGSSWKAYTPTWGGAGGSVFFQDNKHAIYPESMKGYGAATFDIDSGTVVQSIHVEDKFTKSATHKAGWREFDDKLVNYGRILELNLSAFGGNYLELTDTLSAYPRYTTVVIDTSITMTANWTIPSGMKLKFESGNILTTSTYTLTGDYTAIDADQFQIFSLTSNVEGTWVTTPAYPEWFGANGEGTFLTATGDFEAVQKTLDVFCVGININTGTADKIYDKWASGNWVELNGSNYWVEQSLDIKPFGDIRINPHTIIKAVDGFFGNYIISRKTPRRIQGGNFIVPNYWEQSGYISSSQLDADKLAWAWNKNPVIYMPMADLMHTYGGYDYNSMNNTVQDIAISLTQGYDRSVANNKLYKYDGIVIECDTTQYSSGTLEWRRLYTIADWKTGDDFSNIGYLIPPQDSIWKTGATFVVGIAADNKPFEQLTPTDWSNGTVVQNNTNASYFLSFENIYIQYADTAISLKGDLSQYGSYEGIAGYTWNNVTADKCNTTLAANSRVWQHDFPDIKIQCIGTTSAGGEYSSIILEGSSQMRISGTLMDEWHDSTVYMKTGVSGMSGSQVNLTVQGNRLKEQYTKYENANLKFVNPVGPTPIWHFAADLSSGTTSSYWFEGKKMGIKETHNTTIYKNSDPRAILDVVDGVDGSRTGNPTVIFEKQSTQAVTNMGVTTGMITPLLVTTRRMITGQSIPTGFGTSIDFAVDSLDVIPTSSSTPNIEAGKWTMGKIGFRQDDPGWLGTVGLKPAFQIWINDDRFGTNWTNQMTIDSDGRMGLKGTTNPAYDLDLSDAGTLRSDNLTDDGTDVSVSSDLSTTGTITSGESSYLAVSDLLTSSTTIDDTYEYWLFNPSSAITATLPAISTTKGLRIVIYNSNATNSMTIALNGTDKIDGTAGSVTLGTKDKVTYVSSGNATIGWIEESERVKP